MSSPALKSGRRRLKEDAFPSIFAWNEKSDRKSLTSQKALQPPDIYTPVEQLPSCDMEMEVSDTSSELSCVSVKSPLSDLLKENSELKLKLTELQNKLKKSIFRLDSIKDDDSLVRYYTGFVDYETLIAFYEEILEPDASVMRQWSGKRSELDYDETEVGPSYKLPLIEQFFMTLAKIRLGLPELDTAIRFGISQASVSRITNTWINLMNHNLKSIETFPPWHIVKKYMPESFKKDYPNTRIIIDATEFSIERPFFVDSSLYLVSLQK